LEEITEGADRVVVLREGRTVAEFDHEEVSQDTVMHAMAHGDGVGSRESGVGGSESGEVEPDSARRSIAATPASLDEP
jgi:ABC-type sugar transport system ATPase subunit